MTHGIPPPATGQTRLVFLRHGEPDASVRSRCYGRLDPGLSARGREQMRRAWRLLNGESVTAVYVSPSRRAVESARLGATNGTPVMVDHRLREIDFGVFEGMTYDEIARRFPATYEEWMTRPTEVSFPGGESFGEMSVRVLAAIAEIRQRYRGQTVVSVSHGGVNRIALAAALDLDARRVFRLDQGFGSINVIDYIADEPLVRVVNALGLDPC